MVRNLLTKSLAVTSLLATLIIGGGLVYVQASGSKLLSVQSGSMVPAIKKGDLVTVTSVPNGKYTVGDVITFINPKNKQQTITHRIIQAATLENGSKIITKGDANPGPDTPITKEAVIGKVHYNLPLAGYGIDIIRRPIGLLILIYIPALSIVASELNRLAKYYKATQIYQVTTNRAKRKKKKNQGLLAGAKVALLIFALTIPVAHSAYAALVSSATLFGTTITTAPIRANTNNVVIRRVEFHCTLSNTPIVNYLPEIFIYNNGLQDKPVGNWYVRSSRGILTTFRPQTIFDSRDNFDIEPDLKNGLSYAGDYLALFDNQNNLIDAVSWGTDSTYLNPTIVSPRAGSIFRRISTTINTGTAADWAVSVDPCV